MVGIGASAGGLGAFTQFFKELPDATGMAFILVQHLAPHRESELAELLQNHTRMQVAQVQDPSSAEYDGMPQSALSTDLVDVTGTPQELAEKLIGYHETAGAGAPAPSRFGRHFINPSFS